MSTPLKGNRAKEETHQIGSLRDMTRSLDKVPGHCVSGGRIRQILALYFDEKPDLIESCCQALGTQTSADELFPPHELAELRMQILRLITSNCAVTPVQPGPGQQPLLDAELLHAWATWAGDPAAHCAKWLVNGAPAGVTVDFELDGILEPVLDEEPAGIDGLVSDADGATNYSGVESDPEAMAIIDG